MFKWRVVNFLLQFCSKVRVRTSKYNFADCYHRIRNNLRKHFIPVALEGYDVYQTLQVARFFVVQQQTKTGNENQITTKI
jgi:hypothetical protein